jgi:hypothetical protein
LAARAGMPRILFLGGIKEPYLHALLLWTFEWGIFFG